MIYFLDFRQSNINQFNILKVKNFLMKKVKKFKQYLNYFDEYCGGHDNRSQNIWAPAHRPPVNNMKDNRQT